MPSIVIYPGLQPLQLPPDPSSRRLLYLYMAVSLLCQFLEENRRSQTLFQCGLLPGMPDSLEPSATISCARSRVHVTPKVAMWVTLGLDVDTPAHCTSHSHTLSPPDGCVLYSSTKSSPDRNPRETDKTFLRGSCSRFRCTVYAGSISSGLLTGRCSADSHCNHVIFLVSFAEGGLLRAEYVGVRNRTGRVCGVVRLQPEGDSVGGRQPQNASKHLVFGRALPRGKILIAACASSMKCCDPGRSSSGGGSMRDISNAFRKLFLPYDLSSPYLLHKPERGAGEWVKGGNAHI